MNAALASCLSWALAAHGAEAPRAADLVVQADLVVVEEGVVRGEGDVRFALGLGQVEAQRFAFALDGSFAWLEEGSYAGPQGFMRFERLELAPDGRILLDGASLTRCSCDGRCQPWRVSARRVRVDAERGRAAFVGGLVRVAECPILPLPAGLLPLRQRQSGLLAPQPSWTPEGFELGQPLYLVLGRPADLTLTPRLRQERGLRLDSELRYALGRDEGGELHAVAGYDASEERWRGMGSWRHGWASGPWRVASEGSAVSDHDYLDDFGTDFLTRQLPYHESRALLAAGPLRLDHDAFQDPEGARQRLAGIALSMPARAPWPVAPELGLDLSLAGHGSSLAAMEESWLVTRATAGLRGGGPLGPVELEAEARVDGQLLRDLEEEAWADQQVFAEGQVPGGLGEGTLSASARASLPLWGDHGALRHLLEPSLGAGLSVAAEEQGFEVLHPRLTERPAWWAGPRFRSRWLAQRALPLQLSLDLPWTARGFEPQLLGWLKRGHWWGQVATGSRWNADESWQESVGLVSLGRDDGVRAVSLGAAGLQGIADANQLTGRFSWRLAIAGDQWIPSLRLRWSLDDASFVERKLGLGYVSRCDCLGLNLSAAWAEDRQWPDLALRFDIGSEALRGQSRAR